MSARVYISRKSQVHTLGLNTQSLSLTHTQTHIHTHTHAPPQALPNTDASKQKIYSDFDKHTHTKKLSGESHRYTLKG